MKVKNDGILYIVATPIGNLGDITQRALDILALVDCVAAEDTRHSGKLLAYFGIKKPMLSLHDYNELQRGDLLISKLQQGENIALVADAGTPLISDPGYHLVKAVRAAEITVIPIPGACAAITALCASGLPTDKFLFEGFLPAKKTARQSRLEEIQNETRTLIFYESPHRLAQTINDMANIFGLDREAVLARELTKKFETIHSDKLVKLIAWLEESANNSKGEFVILIKGSAKKPKDAEIDAATLKTLNILAAELPGKQAAALTAKITGISKNKLYKKLID